MDRSRLVRSWGHAVLEFWWPPQCPLCGEWIPPRGKHSVEAVGGVHRACLAGLIPSGAQLPSIGPRAQDPTRVLWLWRDDPSFFRLLHAAKYEGRRDLRTVLVARFARWAAPSLRRWGESMVVPVPDDPLRRRQRGFSLVEELAEALAEASGRPLARSLLRRRKSTTALARLPPGAPRRRALQGVIGVGRLAEIPRRTPLVLVDDQVTTGSTLMCCHELLRARGHPTLAVALGGALRAPREL